MGARALSFVMLLACAGGCHREAPAPSQPEAGGDAPAPTPPKGPLAVVTDNKGKAAPDAPFTDLATSAPTTLAAFKGKPLLVNLWATWCVPCVKELPALDALAAARAGTLQVVAISEDMEGAKVVPPFLSGHGIRALKAYHDPNNALMTLYKEASLPVSILYGADGKELWRVSGDLDWQGARAKALLAQAGA